MKFRKYSFLFVCVLFLAFLALSASEGEFGDKGQDKQVRLEKQVKKDNSDLIKFFADKNFNEMAELYVKRGGVIVTPQGSISEETQIRDFWAGAWRDGAKLKFKIKTIKIKDIEIPLIGMRKIDALGFVANEFRIIVEEGGSILQNQEGEDERDYLHQSACPWI